MPRTRSPESGLVVESDARQALPADYDSLAEQARRDETVRPRSDPSDRVTPLNFHHRDVGALEAWAWMSED